MSAVLEAWLVHITKRDLYQQNARCRVRGCWMDLERSWGGVTDEREREKERESTHKLQEKSW